MPKITVGNLHHESFVCNSLKLLRMHAEYHIECASQPFFHGVHKKAEYLSVGAQSLYGWSPFHGFHQMVRERGEKTLFSFRREIQPPHRRIACMRHVPFPSVCRSVACMNARCTKSACAHE